MARAKKSPLYPTSGWRGQPYYTTKEVAEILGISHRTVQNYIKGGQLRGVRLGAIWRIDEAEIDRLQSEGVERGYMTATKPSDTATASAPFPPRIPPTD